MSQLVMTAAQNPARNHTLHVASSFIHSRELRALGEDYPELQRIDRAYRLLERRIERAVRKVDARRAAATLVDFDMLLADARHDAAWATTLDAAKTAREETHVVAFTRMLPARDAAR